MTRFHLHPAQLRALEAIKKGDGRVLLTGRHTGRRYATELAIIAQAASPEEAKLCLEDLRQHGFALLSSDGKRVEPRTGRGRFQYVRFDEEKKSPPRTLPCLDCDEAGCEKCGGTGRGRT